MSHKKHGMDGTPIYKCWISLKARCNNKNDKDYKYYGGRGIKVCDGWINSFETFYKDIGKKPIGKYSIDRINVNGNYCKENCRWATIDEQNSNKRNNHLIQFDNQTLTISQWSRKMKIPLSTLLNRIYRGWEIKDVLSNKNINKKK